jgi:glycosyltransferase involved in cell wall biosynthesis
VVSTIHHPLSVDRRASFVRDRSFRDALGSMTFYPIGMQSTVARRLDRIFTSSRVSARQIATDFGVRPSRLAMVANGVDTELYRPDPDAVRNANEILCVGRASDPNKGIETLVEALALLPPEVTVTLVDQDTPENAGRLRAQELGCGDRLNIVGRVSLAELVRLYQHATLVAVPSRYEGFGLPAVEAMACGTAVVACRSGALPEVLAVAGGGLLAERDDPRSLATSIRRLLDHPELRAELGTRGRAGVAAAYAGPRVGEATARVYAEVLALRGRPASTTTSDSPGRLRASQSNASSTL